MFPTQSVAGSGPLPEPMKRLMVAVLQAVLDDLRGSARGPVVGFRPPTDRRSYEQARAYVTSTDRHWPFSFENLCEAIGLDADTLRGELTRTFG
jgi:hypothetical protein